MFRGLDRDRLEPALHLPLTLKHEGKQKKEREGEWEEKQEGGEGVGGAVRGWEVCAHEENRGLEKNE